MRLNVRTLHNWASVARGVPKEVRLPEGVLDWSVHRAATKLADPAEQRRWLGRAAEHDWDEEDLRREIEREGAGKGGSAKRRGGEEPEGGEPCARCGGTGFEVRYACEHKPGVADAYKLAHGLEVDRRDVREVTGEEIREAVGGTPDVLDSSPHAL